MNGLQQGTCGYNYVSHMQNTYSAKNDIKFVSQVIFSGITLGPHVDQLVIGMPHYWIDFR